ncbi:MAG: CDP-glycerol glycerophosphotransferase family protein, partial [Clostridia bacterium]|nr:CDP-glycerol glycerophosphotransferase family protein [Clostridia bacterium]
MSKLKVIFKKRLYYDLYYGALMLAVAFWGLLVRRMPKYNDIWIIAERAGEARDNGIALFRYIMDNNLHPNTFYVLSDSSPDLYKLSGYEDRVVRTDSLRHMLLYVLSTRSISTQLNYAAPKSAFTKHFKKLMTVKKRFVYLGHGYQKDDVDFLYKKNAKLDLFVADGRREAEALMEKGGYGNHEMSLTGRPRNDGLAGFKVEKEILLMPTHRLWLWRRDKDKIHELFVKSDYYHHYQRLINNPRLHEFLEKSGYELLLYPHTLVQRFRKNFTSNSDLIKVVSRADMDIQDALKRGALLITDYSSVAFDFAYMGKPVIYYQFDYERFRRNQYNEGWFSYAEDGFGPIVNDEEGLMDELERAYKNGFANPEEYVIRCDDMYEFRDSGNCR